MWIAQARRYTPRYTQHSLRPAPRKLVQNTGRSFRIFNLSFHTFPLSPFILDLLLFAPEFPLFTMMALSPFRTPHLLRPRRLRIHLRSLDYDLVNVLFRALHPLLLSAASRPLHLVFPSLLPLCMSRPSNTCHCCPWSASIQTPLLGFVRGVHQRPHSLSSSPRSCAFSTLARPTDDKLS